MDPLQRPLILALEEKASAEGLNQDQLAKILGVASVSYRGWKRGAQPELVPCGRAALWLGVPIQQVLEWEGHWEKLTRVGRVLAPGMLDAGYSARDLAAAAGVTAQTVGCALWGPKLPTEKTLEGFANTIGIERGPLLRARKELIEARPSRALGGSIGRTLNREGRAGLARAGKRALAKARLTGQKRSEIVRELAVPARRKFWESATELERSRFSALHISPRPIGTFGICRGCQRLTYSPASKASDFHGVCLRVWRAEAGWGWWLADLANRGPEAAGPPPQVPPYPRGRRLNASELADHFEAAVLASRAKLKRESVRETAAALHMANDPAAAERVFRKRVARLLELLPSTEKADRRLRRWSAALTLRI